MTHQLTLQKIRSFGLNISPEELGDFKLTGFEDDATAQLLVTNHLMRRSRTASLAPLLPGLLNIKGEPYSLHDYFPFEPFFRTRMSRKTLLKTGRQVSKSVTDTAECRVYLDNGRPVAGKDLKIGDHVLSVDEHRRTVSGVIVDKVANPAKEILRVTTRTGVVLDIADTHPLQRLTGWTTAAELRVGDRVAAIRSGGKFGQHRADPARIVLTAYLIGDGCLRGNFRVTGIGPEVREECQHYGQLFQEKPICVNESDVYFSRRNDSLLKQWMIADGLWNKYSREKHLPAWVFDLSEADAALFLSRLWATDGMITTNTTGKPTITYTSTSRQLAYDVKALLTKFGIPTSIKQRKAGYRQKCGTYKRCRDAFTVRVETRDGWKRFFSAFNVPDKPAVPIADVVENNNRNTLPREIADWIAEIVGECRGTDGPALYQAGLRKKPKYPPTYAKLVEYVRFFRKHHFKHPRLRDLEDLVDGHVCWDEIVSIESLGKHPCWDIEVETKNNYVLDGLVSHNSTSLAARAIIQCNCIPYFSVLCITPLYEMTRRFSNNYIRPFIETSPVRALFMDHTTMNSVLQRSFRNRSQIICSFCFLDAERIRGIAADLVSYDECQSLDIDFIPIVGETMSGSKWGGISQFAGTPKTMENTIQALWTDSSQAEWAVPCHNTGCDYLNIPALSHDLDRMIGPYRDDISEKTPGCICAKCGRPIQPRNGFWVHNYPERRWQFAGYHIPQIVMPMHYGNREKWQALLHKMAGRGNTQAHVFYNEVCGESFDSGSKIVTETDLRNACILPWKNRLEEAQANQSGYLYRILAADWGGGGEEGVSFTVLTVLGIRPDGSIDIIYAVRSLTPHDHLREAKLVLNLAAIFKCVVIAHDYSGAGALRETFIVQAGYPRDRIVPVSYVRAAAGVIMKYHPATRQVPRGYWVVDKTRSLQLTCNQIKTQQIRFFEYDYEDGDNPGLIRDFLALVEEKSDSRTGTDNYIITRDPTRSDDFAQAVNVGCCVLWNMTNMWPDVSAVSHLALSPELEVLLSSSQLAVV